MSVAHLLVEATGVYRGTGDGLESGPFVARIVVAPLPGVGVSIDYEATSYVQGLQHIEHAMLTPGPDGCDRLCIAHIESPFATELVADAPGSNRFAQPAPFGPYALEVVIEVPEPGQLIYAWWWAPTGEIPTEQSRADVRLADG